MKAFKFGKSTVVIHSPLVDMTSEERREWYRREQANGNIVLKEIAQAVNESYWKRTQNKKADTPPPS